MQRDIRKHLFDIRQAADLLDEFTRGRNFDEYEGDPLLRSAVERQFMIVGEALYQATKLDSQLADQFTHTREIINFRHILVHGYAAIENHTVWGILQNDLPTLRRQVNDALRRRGEKAKS
jgi:uncharacterized protein with HEPN domain